MSINLQASALRATKHVATRADAGPWHKNRCIGTKLDRKTNHIVRWETHLPRPTPSTADRQTWRSARYARREMHVHCWTWLLSWMTNGCLIT